MGHLESWYPTKAKSPKEKKVTSRMDGGESQKEERLPPPCGAYERDDKGEMGGVTRDSRNTRGRKEERDR